MKTILNMLVALLIGLTLGAVTAGRLHGDRAADTAALISVNAGPSIEAVRSLAVLTTTRVAVSDVQLTELRGFTGASRAALLVRGDFTLGTDLSKATFDQIDRVNKHAVLVLSVPMASAPRVDLGQTRLVSLASDGLWEIVPGKAADVAVADAAYRDAQSVVCRASEGHEWIQASERSAEQLLAGYFRSIGWTVDISWAD